ncbi:MAG: nuclear transport factor 2 family protein [Bacteroidia bacterium]|nr:nuclear transport factor 2 family protein [Bacteroidia bacterium]
MKYYLLLLLILILPGAGRAQSTPDQQAVMAPVNRLFQGMKLGDSSMVHSAFANTVTMATVFRNREGKLTVRRETSMDGFLKAVGTPHDKVWNEPVWNVKIEIDGDFAQVWCDYAFYLGNQFMHCGVDAFHLFRSDEGWKSCTLPTPGILPTATCHRK